MLNKEAKMIQIVEDKIEKLKEELASTKNRSEANNYASQIIACRTLLKEFKKLESE